MGWEFYDENEEVEGTDDTEPSFSFYDFKKWLDLQGKTMPSASIRENVEAESKENLKEKFKQKTRDRVENNIKKRLADRKKKK